jgi:hypothetical protein
MERHLRQANEDEDGPCQNEQGANASSAPGEIRLIDKC